MSSLLRLMACLMSLALLATPAARAGGYERVAIPSEQGTLTGLFYLPAGQGPFPAVIALLGWSSGGLTVLTAIRKEQAPTDGKPDFKRAAAFYPSCRSQSESPSFSARIPLLILMGDADDWTPAAPCSHLAKAAQGRGEEVGLVLYPGALHDFDHPRLEVRERENIAYSASGTGKATVGTNMAAREDALKRGKAFLTAP